MAEICFDEGRHEYQIDGVIVPSVTKILSPLQDFSMVDADILAKAADLGRNVHRACELYDLGELDRDNLDPILEEYLQGWEAFLFYCPVKFSLIEEKLYSAQYGYCGMLDRIGGYKGNLCQFDIKTGIKSPSTGPQTAAYNKALFEMSGLRVRRRFTVQLSPGKFKLVEHKDKGDFNIFLSCLNIHNYKKNFK